MIVDARSITPLSPTPELSTWTNGKFRLTWRGFFFVPGYRTGDESAEIFVRLSESESLRDALIGTYGHFFAVLDDLKAGTRRAFVDSGGMFKAYLWERTLSTSYRELLDRANLSLPDLDPNSVVEFLQFGILYGEHTLTPSIRKLGVGEIVVLDGDNLRIEQAAVPELGDSAAQRISLPKLLESFAYACRNVRVSLDLTGGLDTRFLATHLRRIDFPFEVALSGPPDTTESILASNVADHLYLPLHLNTPNPMHVDLDDAFRLADGLMDTLGSHIIAQYQADRARRGISLVVGGIGAPLFRDEWWYQDFPRLWRKKSNVARLYDLRFSPLVFPHELLQEPFAEAGRSLRARMLERMRSLTRSRNTETYDIIYHEFVTRQRAGAILSRIGSLYHAVYAPFAEPDALRIGYTLPRLQRVFLRYHRRHITAANPKVARLLTTEQTTASSEPLLFALDVGRYSVNKMRRLAKKIGQRVLGKTFFQPPTWDHEWEARVMKTTAAVELFESLEHTGILQEGVAVDEIPDRLLGRFLTLGDVVRHFS